MTERRPTGMSFETWVDRQVREAQERGEFDDLPGAGKPLPDLGETYDEMWWVKQLAQREKISVLPPMLALRREAEDLLASLAEIPSEAAVREHVDDYNVRLADAVRQPHEGPITAIARRLDPDDVVARWKRARPASTPPSEQPVGIRLDHPEAFRSPSWWTRLTSFFSRRYRH